MSARVGRTSIKRTAFTTSRTLDFVSAKELTLQCGYGPEDWPLVAVKELIDNALDACEEQGIAPEIMIQVDEFGITVADNGTGIPPDVVDRLLDFSVRVSSREAYVATDRGAQGNALKTIVAIPFVLDGTEGQVTIVGGGVESKIVFGVDRIRQRPVADAPRSCKNGSLVRVDWPSIASFEDADDDHVFTSREEVELKDSADRVLRLADDFTFLNPHLTLTVDCFGEVMRTEATEPEHRKWTPSSPTSPHWYEPEHLERLIGAYLTHDIQNGNTRTVREFISEFKGLSSTIKQKAVLAVLGLSRTPLEALATGRDFDHQGVARLLKAMKEHAKPVSPRALGAIGRAHLAARFAGLGISKGLIRYRKVSALGEDGLPQVTEVAFAALENEDTGRRLVTGINWSAAWMNPFRRLGEYGQSLDTLMTEKRFDRHRPIALLVHVAHPVRPVYGPRQIYGANPMKSSDIIQALDVGRKWTRQIKAEEKRPRARGYRASMWTVSRTPLKEVCYQHMEEAWNKASDGGRLPTHWRQVFYVMRPLSDNHPDTDRTLTDTTFKNILEQYIDDFSPGWDVLRGARGVFKEPHSAEDDHGLSMSTINVRDYLRARSPGATIRPISLRYPTHGSVNRIAAVLICEKEGFDELLMAETVPERYDLALMSTKGISAVAARDLARGLRVPCFTLHDLDKNGFVMAADFRFATDIGIRMEDVAEWGLVPEMQYHTNQKKAYANLLRNGATPEEAEFVSQGQRVELNMFTGPQFVEFVECKLSEHGVEKVIPQDATLAAAYRRAALCTMINRHIDEANKAGKKAAVPVDLRERVEQVLAEDPETPWDVAIGQLVRDDQEEVEA